MATGISCPTAGLGPEKAPRAWGVYGINRNSGQILKKRVDYHGRGRIRKASDQDPEEVE